jgi:RNA polymerase sigma-70 factor, ECF subfamily
MIHAIEVAISPVSAAQESEQLREFRVLYEAQASNVSRFLSRLGVPANQLEDARQEVFLEAYRYLPGFRGESSLKTWLYRLCVSEARRSRKRENVRRWVQVHFGSGPEGSTQGELSNEQSARLVEKALRTLPSGEREAFVLYELEGLSGAEIAAVLEITEASVWRRLHYSRERFRAAIEEGRTG